MGFSRGGTGLTIIAVSDPGLTQATVQQFRIMLRLITAGEM
ncbi:hypothetical protein GTPT_1836 [Tatumella ptyseos ATCC 33301]|uniref:Uncharacterized protein n=1 Tax=Tatumella ptyseos ATCC 33301 TaxID=1005995 RepID=A0A085JGA1_9GAMM|nr:hypothetical protein GTPT_1836 [Tatumella ptyseos ATCC 33301]